MLSTDTATLVVDADVEETFKCRANDVLFISFSNGLGESGSCKQFPPLFTHQIFEDETIPLSSDDKVGITININSTDLSSTLDVTQSTVEEDQAYIRHKLTKIAPVAHDPACNFSEPIGTKLKTLNIDEDKFELYLAKHTDSGASELLHRAEKIAMLYIETADSVDFSDERWEILWIYTTSLDSTTGLQSIIVAGYMTLFTFYNPFVGK